MSGFYRFPSGLKSEGETGDSLISAISFKALAEIIPNSEQHHHSLGDYQLGLNPEASPQRPGDSWIHVILTHDDDMYIWHIFVKQMCSIKNDRCICWSM